MKESRVGPAPHSFNKETTYFFNHLVIVLSRLYICFDRASATIISKGANLAKSEKKEKCRHR